MGRYGTTQEVTAASLVVRWHKWETRPLLLVTQKDGSDSQDRLLSIVTAYNLLAGLKQVCPFRTGTVASKLGQGR